MKLPDFKKNNVFNNIRKKMGIKNGYIKNIETDLNFNKIKLESAQFEKLERGIGLEIQLDDLEVGKDNTIKYDDKNVILYIRDQYSYDGQYKYHVSWCRTLREMRNNKKLNRYVISRRTDGTFYVNILDKNSQKMVAESVEQELCVCKNCLTEINYNEYKVKKNLQNEIYENFSLREFLEKYDTRFKQLPKYTAHTAPKNEYPPNWNEISKEFKTIKEWRCEKCGADYKDNKAYLDVHHIDSNKFNVNFSNLKALCKKCHGEEPGHGHYKKLNERRYKNTTSLL